MSTINHPKNEEEVWSCAHHSEASRKGFKLQTQKYTRKEVVAAEKSNKIEVKNSNTAEDDLVDGVKALPQRETGRRLSLRDRKKRLVDKAGKNYDGTPRPGTSKENRM